MSTLYPIIPTYLFSTNYPSLPSPTATSSSLNSMYLNSSNAFLLSFFPFLSSSWPHYSTSSFLILITPSLYSIHSPWSFAPSTSTTSPPPLQTLSTITLISSSPHSYSYSSYHPVFSPTLLFHSPSSPSSSTNVPNSSIYSFYLVLVPTTCSTISPFPMNMSPPYLLVHSNITISNHYCFLWLSLVPVPITH